MEERALVFVRQRELDKIVARSWCPVAKQLEIEIPCASSARVEREREDLPKLVTRRTNAFSCLETIDSNIIPSSSHRAFSVLVTGVRAVEVKEDAARPDEMVDELYGTAALDVEAAGGATRFGPSAFCTVVSGVHEERM